MSETITLTDLIRDYKDGAAGWGVQFEHLRITHATEVLTLLHLIRRDGITEPVKIKDNIWVTDGYKRIYVATLLGIRDIPVEYV